MDSRVPCFFGLELKPAEKEVPEYSVGGGDEEFAEEERNHT